MAFLRAFGSYLPSRVVPNAEIAPLVGEEEAWIEQMTGIRERRFAGIEETVTTLGTSAAKDCLERAGVQPQEIGLLIVASGSLERRFPGAASTIGAALGIAGTPAIDIPMASAGSLVGIAMAQHLAAGYGNVLVVGSEIMSRVAPMSPNNRDTAIVFGDGAGACLVSAQSGFAEIVDSSLHTDGDYAESLRLPLDAPIQMDGRSIILHATRKMPRVIVEVLERNRYKADDVGVYLVHQANLNLILRVAQSLGVEDSKFYCNVQKYGNTSSASMLIAAAEWHRTAGKVGRPIVFAAFGAGLNWGALIAKPAGA